MINIIILGKLLYIGIKNWIQSLSDVFWNRNFKPALCIEGYTLANFEKKYHNLKKGVSYSVFRAEFKSGIRTYKKL